MKRVCRSLKGIDTEASCRMELLPSDTACVLRCGDKVRCQRAPLSVSFRKSSATVPMYESS